MQFFSLQQRYIITIIFIIVVVINISIALFYVDLEVTFTII